MLSFLRRLSAYSLILAVFCGVAACHKSASFKVKGNVYRGAGMSLLLEKADFSGNWIPVDSTKIGNNDDFSISYDAPATSEIFRLNLNGRFVYLPVDSTETLTLKSSADTFGFNHTLEGNSTAPRMAAFDKEVARIESIANPDSTEAFKRRVYSEYIYGAKGSILSWYIITKTIGGNPLFSYLNPQDATYLAAIATDFKQYRPEDPHTPILEEMALQALKKRNAAQGKKRVVEAESSAMIEINLPDASGKNIPLSSVLGKGKPVVVIFSVTTAGETSGKLTMAIRSVYDALAGKATFYQVCLDTEPYAWRESVKNIPWITVLDAQGSASSVARSYNVENIPSFFIYNSSGELIDKTENINELASKIP